MGFKMYERVLSPPDKSFFLFGLRGVGKSTWARVSFPGALWLDLLDEATLLNIVSDPGWLAGRIGGLPSGSWVVIDEVQRHPPLLNEVHRRIEESGLRFVLLGSSARKLKTAGTNLLAGRALWRTMHPLLPEELGPDFDLTRQLETGSIPLVWTANDPEETLRSYVHLYLREEIRAEGLARNLPAFVRMLPVAALMHGQIVNASSIARDAAIARATVNGYLELLEDTLVAWRLPAMETRLRVRERRHPKLYWVDPGLVRAARRHLGAVGDDEKGALFEGWILTLLRAANAGDRLFEDIGYWSPADARKLEVDFLLRRGREFLAIEVKSQSRAAALDLRGLRALSGLKGLTRRLLVYPGEDRLVTPDGIEILPLRRFLEALSSRALWP